MSISNHTTVLIVDDNVDFHTVVRAALARLGYEVKSLYNGSIKDIAAIAATCDLVLLDVDLPGNSGIEITGHLKNDVQCSGIPIIIVSGNADIDVLCNGCGADSVLVKPFTTTILINEVERLLQKPKLEQHALNDCKDQ